VVAEVYRQQSWLMENKKQSIEDRIVSLIQPHIRPIIRGKAGKPVEFGAKISASYFEGYVFLDRISWDNFNESRDLKSQIMAKLSHTSETAIAISFLVMNLSTWLRRVFCAFLCLEPKITPFFALLITRNYRWRHKSPYQLIYLNT
jgi:hypothetical protein